MARKFSKSQNLTGFVTDEKTGEVAPIKVFMPSNRPKTYDWLMIFHSGTQMLARDKDFSGESFRVFFEIISHIEYENKITVTQAQIAELLGMKQPCVSRAFRLLVKKGILEESRKYGTTKTYKLSTDFGWKGTVTNLNKKLFEEREERRNSIEGVKNTSKSDESVAA